MKQAPLNSNQYNTDIDNHRTQDQTGLQANSQFNNVPNYNYESGNENEHNNNQTDCFGKIKSCYTNPDTPCQNYCMMFLTLVCLVVTIFVLYSIFGRG